ncbi:hypothetical protein BDZ97DRAFT_1804701 [Flammula alnicola]|nr:hypothetical protein BDZ97DRAFT_1804701 [Flammula alnicola]
MSMYGRQGKNINSRTTYRPSPCGRGACACLSVCLSFVGCLLGREHAPPGTGNSRLG